MNAHARHVTAAKAMTLQSLARQMLDEAGGDINKAATKLDNYAANIKRFNDEFRMLGVRAVLQALPIAQRAATKREATKIAWKQPPGAARTRAMFKMAERAVTSALMGMELQIGSVVKKLADWTGTEVHAHAEERLAAAATGVRNARFLVAVGRAAGAKKIGELGDATVERLHKEAMSSDV